MRTADHAHALVWRCALTKMSQSEATVTGLHGVTRSLVTPRTVASELQALKKYQSLQRKSPDLNSYTLD